MPLFTAQYSYPAIDEQETMSFRVTLEAENEDHARLQLAHTTRVIANAWQSKIVPELKWLKELEKGANVIHHDLGIVHTKL